MSQLDLKSLFGEFRDLLPDEDAQARRLVADGESQDYYIGMLNAYIRVIQFVSDPAQRRAITVLAIRTIHCLEMVDFPDSI